MSVVKKPKQKGFTLIEIVVVIVILGILAATAMPRFVNLSNSARNAATDAVAGAAGSGLQMLYAACLVATLPTDTRCPAAYKTALKDPSANFKLIKQAAGYVLNATVDTYGNFILGKENYSFSQMNCTASPKVCTLILKNKSDITYLAYISLPQLP